MVGPSSANGLVHESMRHDDDLGVLDLAQVTEPCEGLFWSVAGAAARESDCLVADGPSPQRGPQLECQVLSFGEDLCVMDRDRSG